jgi:hypothetical protein
MVFSIRPASLSEEFAPLVVMKIRGRDFSEGLEVLDGMFHNALTKGDLL